VIEWRRFEALVEALFAQAGFETRSQSHGADEGIDVWLHSRSDPGTPVSVVQCKHWQGKRVGVDKVRELRGVMAAKNLSRGQFATTSTFTEDAIAFAKENGINLLDVQGLLALIATRTKVQQDALLAVALEGEYWKPTCVNCGVKMVERTPRKGGAAFWGCASYPKCNTTMARRGG
jgi:restriction system protein